MIAVVCTRARYLFLLLHFEFFTISSRFFTLPLFYFSLRIYAFSRFCFSMIDGLYLMIIYYTIIEGEFSMPIFPRHQPPKFVARRVYATNDRAFTPLPQRYTGGAALMMFCFTLIDFAACHAASAAPSIINDAPPRAAAAVDGC